MTQHDTQFAQWPQRLTQRQELRLRLVAQVKDGTVAVEALNISRTGFLVRTAAPLSEGDRLSLILPEAGPREAAVVWRSGNLAGCNFDAPLSRAALSAALLQGEARRPQPEERAAAGSDASAGETDGRPLSVRAKLFIMIAGAVIPWAVLAAAFSALF
ncbi:PilZ domain-containing protein [Qipengyuania thermophila]|uniref:PilZ domain-containing protein n=1 Tax=Qipengyuania thermophila TaxID=2509361 RepID=UPI0013ED8448|nr:PilZ domain-containing protein [Qipengyuania thermophila]